MPERVAKRGWSRAVRCPMCGREYSHPDYSWEQLERVWDHGNRRQDDDD